MSSSREMSFPVYQAVVTARFLNMESGINAREAIAALPSQVPTLVVQLLQNTPPPHPLGVQQSVPGETGVSMIVHLPDPERSEEIIRLCTLAGATHATFYPARSVIRGAS